MTTKSFLQVALIGALVVATSLAQTSASFALDGGTGSHGGDTLVADFNGTSARLREAIKKMKISPEKCPDPVVFSELVSARLTTSSYSVQLDDGTDVDAKNWFASSAEAALLTGGKDFKGKGIPRIEISRLNLWEIKDNSQKLVQINLHEHYGLLGDEDTNDFSKTDGCLDALRNEGVDLESVAVKTKAVTKIESRFARAEAYLKCDGIQEDPSLEIRIVASKRPADAEPRHMLTFEAHYPDGEKITFGKSPEWGATSAQPAPLENLFRYEYDLRSGIGEFLIENLKFQEYGNLKFNGTMDRFMKMSIRSFDHINWKLTLMPDTSYSRFDKPLIATCRMLTLQ